MKRIFRAVPGKGIVASTCSNNRTILASWNGIFSPRFIMQNSSITDKSEAQRLSDYLYENSYDSGFRTAEEALDWMKRWAGGLDGVYKEMLDED